MLALALTVLHFALVPHGSHGVRGSVALAPASAHASRVTVTLDVHDLRARPVHIHGGRCGSFFGLPFGAHTIRGRHASFVVRLPLRKLAGGVYALDVHAAPGAPAWVTCANLG